MPSDYQSPPRGRDKIPGGNSVKRGGRSDGLDALNSGGRDSKSTGFEKVSTSNPEAKQNRQPGSAASIKGASGYREKMSGGNVGNVKDATTNPDGSKRVVNP